MAIYLPIERMRVLEINNKASDDSGYICGLISPGCTATHWLSKISSHTQEMGKRKKEKVKITDPEEIWDSWSENRKRNFLKSMSPRVMDFYYSLGYNLEFMKK